MMEMCLTFLNICSVQEIIRCVMPALQVNSLLIIAGKLTANYCR